MALMGSVSWGMLMRPGMVSVVRMRLYTWGVVGVGAMLIEELVIGKLIIRSDNNYLSHEFFRQFHGQFAFNGQLLFIKGHFFGLIPCS